MSSIQIIIAQYHSINAILLNIPVLLRCACNLFSSHFIYLVYCGVYLDVSRDDGDVRML
jgi:hypothetical protein